MNIRSAKESKNNILNAALKAFSEHGYSGASMRMIAGYAGISVGGLYLYFKNKEDLCRTLLKERLDELYGKVEKAVRNVNDPVEAIEKFITICLEYARKHKEIILVQNRDKGLAFGIDVKRSFFHKQRELVEKIIEEGIRTGDFFECNTAEVTKIVIAVLRGFVLSILLEPDSLFSNKECCKFILRGLLKSK